MCAVPRLKSRRQPLRKNPVHDIDKLVRLPFLVPRMDVTDVFSLDDKWPTSFFRHDEQFAIWIETHGIPDLLEHRDVSRRISDGDGLCEVDLTRAREMIDRSPFSGVLDPIENDPADVAVRCLVECRAERSVHPVQIRERLNDIQRRPRDRKNGKLVFSRGCAQLSREHVNASSVPLHHTRPRGSRFSRMQIHDVVEQNPDDSLCVRVECLLSMQEALVRPNALRKGVLRKMLQSGSALSATRRPDDHEITFRRSQRRPLLVSNSCRLLSKELLVSYHASPPLSSTNPPLR
jgi:hypothetical protein